MFLDASAIIAILASAPSADGLLATLDVPGRRIFCSPVARLAAAQEIADRLRRSRAGEVATAEDLAAAEDLVDRLLELFTREMATTMQLLGVGSVSELGPEHVRLDWLEQR